MNSTDVRDALTRFCQVELDLDDATSSYKQTTAPTSSARTDAYNVLTRALVSLNTPWLSLAAGGFLHVHVVKSQASLQVGVIRSAVSAALVSLGASPGSSEEESRTNLLQFVKKELREHRTSSVTGVKFVDKLPRTLAASSVARAPPQVESTAQTWVTSRATLAAARVDHLRTMAELQAQREEVLNVVGVRDYLTGIGGAGQPVRLDGPPEKFKLRHSVSTRRNPIRETHVHDAVERAVNVMAADGGDLLSIDVDTLSELIMSEAMSLAGTETKDVFSLNAQRGRKRAAENE